MNNLSKKSVRPQRYLIVDGLNNFVPLFLVNQEVSAKSEPVGGVTGFLKRLHYLIEDFCPTRVIVVWENGGASSRRKKISPEYKENRNKIKDVKLLKKNKSMKDVLALDVDCKVRQLLTLNNLIKCTPITQVFVPDTECDDIIAYLVKNKFKTDDADKIIISNDKDFYQLLDDDTISIYDPMTRRIIKSKDVVTKFGIHPRNFCLAKTLAGDNSDNVAGVNGVGFKTALKRFPELANASEDINIQNLLESARNALKANKKSPKVYKSVSESEELLKRNWDLMYLDSSTLSASQIAKIDGIIEQNKDNKMDKLQFVKTLINSSINTNLDIEKFCTNLRTFLR